MQSEQHETSKNLNFFIHDVRNPISSISTLLDLLIMKKCDLEQQKIFEHVKLCKSQLEKIRVTLSNYTDINKIEDIPFYFKTENVGMLIEKIINTFKPRLKVEKKNILFNPTSLDFKVDRRTFTNMMHNLIEHILNLSSSNSTPKINAYLESDYLYIDCIIEGPAALTNEDRDKIFNPHECIHDNTSGIRYNKGFGLTYNQAIARQLGGKIQINHNIEKNEQHLLLMLPKNNYLHTDYL